MRVIVLPVGWCQFLEENESGLLFRRNKIWPFTECTTPYRPSVVAVVHVVAVVRVVLEL